MDNRPIGVFDSGVGGLSLLRELRSLLPNENFIYISDNAFAPYGSLSPEDIRERSQALTHWLTEQSCKLIVVACNTATTNAIESLRKTHSIPFVGIEPAIKPAALQTKTGVVGVLATKGTLSSGLFHETSKTYGQGVRIIEKEGKHLGRDDRKWNAPKRRNGATLAKLYATHDRAGGRPLGFGVYALPLFNTHIESNPAATYQNR